MTIWFEEEVFFTMMTTAEILNEISRMPVDQQKDLKKRILEDPVSNGRTKSQMTQDEFDQILYDDGLTHVPLRAKTTMISLQSNVQVNPSRKRSLRTAVNADLLF